MQLLARAPWRAGLSREKRDLADFCRHKFLKSRIAALSKAGARWYIPSRDPRAFAKGCLLRKPPDGNGALWRWPDSFRHSVFRQGTQRFIAGWSSPVARQAHNLKVIGSNPIPATRHQALENKSFSRAFCCPDFDPKFRSRKRGAAVGKSQRKTDGVAREAMTQL
jgi:hypothetical protein